MIAKILHHRTALVLLGAIAAFARVDAFTTVAPLQTTFVIKNSGAARTRTSQASVQTNLFGGLFGGNSDKAAGPPVVFEIGAKDVKVGALRFLLQIYLVGIQNEPAPKSWLTKQGDEGDLQIFFQDGSAMLSLDLQEYGIKAIRYGEKPSLQYMLQESVLVHGILDELNNVAFEVQDIAEDKRLLQLSDEDAIAKIRESLPARKA